LSALRSLFLAASLQELAQDTLCVDPVESGSGKSEGKARLGLLPVGLLKEGEAKAGLSPCYSFALVAKSNSRAHQCATVERERASQSKKQSPSLPPILLQLVSSTLSALRSFLPALSLQELARDTRCVDPVERESRRGDLKARLGLLPVSLLKVRELALV